jgi:3-deoxy-7-phosphoheptulonate synthase
MSSTAADERVLLLPRSGTAEAARHAYQAVAPHQPDWPDHDRLKATKRQLEGLPPLVSPKECDQLKDRMASVARGEAFLLQGGDCAETFAGTTAANIEGKFRTLLQMAVVLTYAASVPVVKVGRMAGQFGKPRSAATEVRDGVELPVYRGDAVNGIEFTAAARTPDPARLLDAYHCSAAALNQCRTFASAGYADLRQVHAWNRDFVARSPAGQRYEELAGEIDRAIAFMHACGADPQETRVVEFYSSHEALILDYEHALMRIDPPTGRVYDLSAHLLWIGERTRAVGGAHVEFARQVSNPVAVKIGPSASAQDVLALIQVLDADREPGRLTLVTRLGARRVRQLLPPLVEAVAACGSPVVWVCDPMHGNTTITRDGRKTRHLDDILDEVAGFFEVHRALGTRAGGIHIEFTGADVTECTGGGHRITEGDLGHRYETACDPRLNRSQSLDLAFCVAGLLRRQQHSPPPASAGLHRTCAAQDRSPRTPAMTPGTTRRKPALRARQVSPGRCRSHRHRGSAAGRRMTIHSPMWVLEHRKCAATISPSATRSTFSIWKSGKEPRKGPTQRRAAAGNSPLATSSSTSRSRLTASFTRRRTSNLFCSAVEAIAIQAEPFQGRPLRREPQPSSRARLQ